MSVKICCSEHNFEEKMLKLKINLILIFHFLLQLCWSFAKSDTLNSNLIEQNVIGDVLETTKKSFSQYQVLKVKHNNENREQIFRDLQDSKFCSNVL